MNCTITLTRGQNRTESNRHPDRATALVERAARSGRVATGATTPPSDRTAVDVMAQSANKTAITAEGDR